MTLRKTEPSIIGILPQLNTCSSKTWHSQDLKYNWCLAKSIKNKLDRQTVVFILAVDHINTRRNITTCITFPSPEVEFHHETHGHAVVRV